MAIFVRMITLNSVVLITDYEEVDIGKEISSPFYP